MHSRTFRLFPMPSFASGVARLLDIGATFNEYNVDTTGLVADSKALRADWAMIGSDLAAAMVTIHECTRISEDTRSASEELTKAWMPYLMVDPEEDCGTQMSLQDA